MLIVGLGPALFPFSFFHPLAFCPRPLGGPFLLLQLYVIFWQTEGIPATMQCLMRLNQCIDENACDVTIVVLMMMMVVVVMPLLYPPDRISSPRTPQISRRLCPQASLFCFVLLWCVVSTNRAKNMDDPGRVVWFDKIWPNGQEALSQRRIAGRACRC